MRPLQVLIGCLFASVFLFGVFQIITYQEELHKNTIAELATRVEELNSQNFDLQQQFLNLDIPFQFEEIIEDKEPYEKMYYQEQQPYNGYNQGFEYANEEIEKEIIEEQEEEDEDDLPFNEWVTSWKCYRGEDYSDICVYKNLCYDGKDVIFLNPELPDDSTTIYEYPLKGPEVELNFDWTYWEPNELPPPMSQYVPFMSTYAGWGSKWPFQANPLTLQKKTNTIEFMDGSMYYTPFEPNAGNIWHVTMQLLGLWEAQILNETLNYHNKLPSIDYVVFPTPFDHPGWKRQTQRAMAQEHSVFLTKAWFLESGIDLEELNYGRHYDDSDWPSNWRDNFSPLPRKNDDVEVSSENLICSRRAVVLSQKPRLFSGLMSATRYRERALGLIGLKTGPPKGLLNRDYQIHTSGKVLIDFRGDQNSRNIVNVNQIVEMVEYYGLEAIAQHSWNQENSYEEQVKLVSEVDVYIIVHGAGVTNCMFMTPRSTLIEVSPYGMRVPMYQYAAEALGLNYVNIVSWIKGPLNDHKCGGELYTTEFYNECQNISSVANNLSPCNIKCKNACAVVPIYDIEMALINAYDYLGVNINPNVGEMYTFNSTMTRNHFNNFHDIDNFLWVLNPWNFDPSNYPREYARDHTD